MPLVTVSEVLRFALPFGASVEAGSAGLGKTVSWARLLRARPATLASVEQGEVWLLSSGALQQAGDARNLARLISAVADAGVVAFMVTDSLPEAACEEANAADTPVIRLPPGSSLADTEQAIIGFVSDRDRAIAQRVQEVYERLIATLVEDRGTELQTGIVHDVTGKAVYLLDVHFQPTTQAGGTPRTAEALAQVRRRFWEGQAAAVVERMVTLRTPEGGEGLSAVVRPLVLRGSVEGYLALIGERDQFSDFDYQVATKTTSVLAIEIAKQAAVVEARLRVQGDFLEDLLDTPAQLNDAMATRARGLGYDLTRPHAAFVLRPRQSGERPITPRQHQRFVDLARRRLVLANAATLLREVDGSVQVLAPCPADLPTDNPAAVATWVEGVRRDLVVALEPDPLPVLAGVGRIPDERITHFAAIREALRAADIASTLPGETSTLHFSQLGALRLIFELAGNPELHAFQADLIGPLEEYDRQHRSEFVQTLDAFFRAGGNHVQAARDLHVHRNTLIYRLDRIRDLLGGANLEDPDTRLNLQLALKVRSALGNASPRLPLPTRYTKEQPTE